MNAPGRSRRLLWAAGLLGTGWIPVPAAQAQNAPMRTQLVWIDVTATRISGAPGAIPNDAIDDTRELQDAIDEANTYLTQFTPVRGGAIGAHMFSVPVVYFPRGRYLIGTPTEQGTATRLNMPRSISLMSDEKAIIDQTAADEILHFGDVRDVWIRGLKFVGGTRQLYFSNANVDATLIDIYDSEFELSSDYAIYTVGTAPSDAHMSANLTINKSKFIKVNKVLHNVCDNALVKDSWIWIGGPTSPNGGNFSADTAAFYNYGYDFPTSNGTLLRQGGVLRFDSMFGVPTMGPPGNRLANVRWVDLHGGSFYAKNSRFGGEDGGMTIVYSFVDTRSQIYPFLGNVVSIESSTIAAGIYSLPDTSVVYLKTGVPQHIRIVGNEGIIDAPYIRADAALNLGTYFDGVASASQRYKVELGPNLTWNTVATLVPKELRRFMQPKYTPFPLGPQPATYTPNSNWAKSTYDIPDDVASFTAIVTVSANPLLQAYAGYRGSLSYMVSLVRGYDYGPPIGGISDYLLTQPLLQAQAPSVLLPLSLQIYFGQGDSPPPNGNKQPAALNRKFTVRVDNTNPAYALGNGETFVSLEVVHVGY